MEGFIDAATFGKLNSERQRQNLRSQMTRFRKADVRREALRQYVSGSSFESDAELFRLVFEAAGIEPLSAASKQLALSAGMHVHAAWATTPARVQGGRCVSLNPIAVFSLMRASLEHSALGLWMLRPDTSRERIRNYSSLLVYSQRRYWSALNEHSDAGQPVVDPPMTESDLREILVKVGIELDSMPSSTALLTDATMYEATPSLSWTPLVAWQVSSGIAHGIPWASKEAHKTRVDPETNNSIVALNLDSFHHVLAASVALFEAFVSRIEILNYDAPQL